MLHFSKIYKEDLEIVGKKAVELARLTWLGVPLPDGFVITTSFFDKFLKQTGIDMKIQEIQKLNHPSIAGSIEKLFDPIKKQILHTHIPEDLVLELHKNYKKFAGEFKHPPLNVFSSSPFNGKSILFHNVKGDSNLIIKIKEIWSLNISKPVAIIVQKNIQSKIRGRITTDDPRLSASLAGELGFASVPTKDLEQIARKIQKHFYFPQEIDYVIDKNKIYITGIKPLTKIIVDSSKPVILNRKIRKVLAKGIPANIQIVTGAVKLINNYNLSVKNSEIAVTTDINNKIYNRIKKAKGIISVSGLHFKKSIKSPAILGVKNATKLLQNGTVVTLNGSNGEIYLGGII
ncbi:MAG: hypothetical protein HYW62_00280 [Candidatus Levybacteria bacterium]|nr:hypothetical protein [Candidatus Levybacteria bacterium]